ncbi:glycoside hydrolase [Lipomyces japonicus]|uniref:glycoside hydrolase n=1 Tax=Lipomyces japonicus TaxID=56871 RepID=UPI0034CF7D77
MVSLWLWTLISGAIVAWGCARPATAFPRDHLEKLKEETREAFYHGWNAYLTHAFPDDELAPLSCIGRGSDRKNALNFGVNDALGDFSLTLVDSIDTLAIMGDQAEFEAAVKKIERFVQFDLPSRVQVFETTIRMLGGLLSAHTYATSSRLGSQITWYDGSLLRLAKDLGDRIMPAFDTPTGIPLPRVNLQSGDPHDNITETCAAGAGSLVIEMATLSRLTGDGKYEAAARRAFFAIWDRRTTSLNLVGSAIDAVSGMWLSANTGIGASVDSFFEYALKAYIFLDDAAFLDVFVQSYDAIKHVMLEDGGWLYRNVHILTGSEVTTWIDSLSAFFAGVQVLAGDIDGAVKSHLVYYKLWMAYGGLPERWDYATSKGSVGLPWYGLRPEFVESNYMLYRATGDPFYLHVGAQILSDLQARTRVACGFATVHDVRTAELEDRMESYFLSETIKYLYLLFDVDNPINHDDSSFVFSTEAHPLRLNIDLLNHSTALTQNQGHARGRWARTIPKVGRDVGEDKQGTKLDKILARIFDFSSDQRQQDHVINNNNNNNDNDNIENNNFSELLKNSTCQFVPAFNSFYSPIASWSQFYHLDGLYNFASPVDNNNENFVHDSHKFASHSQLFASNICDNHTSNNLCNNNKFENVSVVIENQVRGRTIIDLPPTDPHATSLPLRAVQILEVIFPPVTTTGNDGNSVESNNGQSKLVQRGIDIEAFSLDGHRVKFALDHHRDHDVYEDDGTDELKILSIGSKRVLGTVRVQSLMSSSPSSLSSSSVSIFDVSPDGKIRLHGYEVNNLIIG